MEINFALLQMFSHLVFLCSSSGIANLHFGLQMMGRCSSPSSIPPDSRMAFRAATEGEREPENKKSTHQVKKERAERDCGSARRLHPTQ